MYALSHIVILYSCWHKRASEKEKREKKKKRKKREKKKKKEREESNKVPYSRKRKLDEKLVGVVLFCANLVAHQ